MQSKHRYDVTLPLLTDRLLRPSAQAGVARDPAIQANRLWSVDEDCQIQRITYHGVPEREQALQDDSLPWSEFMELFCPTVRREVVLRHKDTSI